MCSLQFKFDEKFQSAVIHILMKWLLQSLHMIWLWAHNLAGTGYYSDGLWVANHIISPTNHFLTFYFDVGQHINQFQTQLPSPCFNEMTLSGHSNSIIMIRQITLIRWHFYIEMASISSDSLCRGQALQEGFPRQFLFLTDFSCCWNWGYFTTPN